MKPWAIRQGWKAALCAALASQSPAVVAQSSAGTAVIDRPVSAASASAPNVVVILADDVGFAMNSPFGGPVPTPNYDALAAGGVRFNRFHTTAQCSPTRAALLTGRNPHRVEIGSIIDLATADPGYTSVLPKSAATVGRVLQLNGYSTSWFGKVHVTPQWELTAAGPFDRWPNRLGFDYFYGFMGGETDQFHPALYENTVAVPTPDRPGYILDADLIDRTIGWIRTQKSIAPERPFFTYLATGSVHAPQEAFPEWIARFRGQFAQGWDRLREETFARQKQLGVIPDDAVLTPRPSSVPAWSSLTGDQQAVAERLMEVAAAQSAFFDAQLGRLFAALKADGLWDNTIVLYVNGDNGAAHVGGPLGSALTGPGATIEGALASLDLMGSDEAPTNYNAGWAWAMNTPFPYWKQMSGHLGGIRNGLTVSWPGHVAKPGSIQSQFGFVTDIAPTIYEATGVQLPDYVDGTRQMPLDGQSLIYALSNPAAPSRHGSQYFEINGSRGFYDGRWFAGTTPPGQIWERSPTPPLEEWNWELYDLDSDYSQSRNLTGANPQKLAELKTKFAATARDIGFQVKLPPAGRPQRSPSQPFWSNGRRHFKFYPSAVRVADQALPSLLGRSFVVEATINVATAASGTIVGQGGRDSGWNFYLRDGTPELIYKADPLPPEILRGVSPVAPGPHVVALAMRPLGDRSAPVEVELKVADAVVAKSVIRTPIAHLSLAGVGLGRTFAAPLPEGLERPFAFADGLESVQITVD